MKTISGFELHFVPKRLDNGTTKNKRLLAVRDHEGIPLFFESMALVNEQVEAMSKLVVDVVFYAVPKRRKIETGGSEHAS